MKQIISKLGFLLIFVIILAILSSILGVRRQINANVALQWVKSLAAFCATNHRTPISSVEFNEWLVKNGNGELARHTSEAKVNWNLRERSLKSQAVVIQGWEGLSIEMVHALNSTFYSQFAQRAGNTDSIMPEGDH